ncbi:hypothetical protein P8605_18025 [Streptomyces sp. T-3]|nr:hypothetical protein [Streptomyces sp. T-3]
MVPPFHTSQTCAACGQAPEAEARPATIDIRRADGTHTAMLRWILDFPVWHVLLEEHGFDVTGTDTVHAPGSDGRPPIATHVLRSIRRT